MPYTTNTRKLKRKRNQRRALVRTLAASLVSHRGIITTVAKAKTLRPFVERLVTVAKKDSVSSRRYVARFLPKMAVDRVHRLAADYKERPGGYLRIMRVAKKRADNASMARIEFV